MTKMLNDILAAWPVIAAELMETAQTDLLSKLTETSTTSFVKISDLSESEAASALAAFKGLADDQRGYPEDMGGAGRANANKGLTNATGIYTLLTEHIGDLTHRMAQRYCERMGFGYEMVLEKVNRGLRYLQHPYGMERDNGKHCLQPQIPDN